MDKVIYIDPQSSIGAVRLNGVWRFVYGENYMFLLDYTKYDDTYNPQPTAWRYDALIVDKSNAEAWIQSLDGELTQDDIPNTRWYIRNSLAQVKLTYVIDFDQQLWVAYDWSQDEPYLPDYQPDGWNAFEGNVFDYLPPDVSALWDGQLINYSLMVSANGMRKLLISPKTRAGQWGGIPLYVNKSRATIELSILQLKSGYGSREEIFSKEIPTPDDDTNDLELQFNYTIDYTKHVTVSIEWRKDYLLEETIAKVNIPPE